MYKYLPITSSLTVTRDDISVGNPRRFFSDTPVIWWVHIDNRTRIITDYWPSDLPIIVKELEDKVAKKERELEACKVALNRFASSGIGTKLVASNNRNTDL